MSWQFCLILFIGVLLEWKLTLSAPAEIGKTKEKGRAYEFGFSIEEQQHRYEKKDENGIVMGEFGFITADGIYHVTVYATDENGKFKIISMKSYPYGNPTSPEKKIMIARLPTVEKPVVTPTVVKAMMPDGKSCGGCVLPKKFNLLPADVMGKKQSDNEKAVFRPLSKDVVAYGKENGGAGIVDKGTPTEHQSNSLSKTTMLILPSGASGTDGKGSSASQKPLTQPPYDGSNFIQPRFSTSEAQKPNSIGGISSKVEPKTPAKNGNEYQLTNNFLTQTTPTPTRHFTQNSGINTPKTNTQVALPSRENTVSSINGNLLPKTQSHFHFQPTLHTNENLNSLKHLTKSPINNTSQRLQNSLSKTAPNIFSQFPANQIGRKTTNHGNPARSSLGSGFPSSSDNQFATTTGRKPSSQRGSQKTKFLNPSTFSNIPLKPSVPIDFVTPSQNSQATERNIPSTSQHSKNFKNSQTSRNTNPLTTKSYGPSTYNTNRTPQHFPSSLKDTNPTRSFTQLSENNEYKSKISNNPPEINNRFGFSSQENQLTPTSRGNKKYFPLVGGSQQTTKFPNPLVTSTIPLGDPIVYNTKTQSPSSSVSFSNNSNKPFAIPAYNRKTTSPSRPQGATKIPFTQNAVKAILKSTKEPKPFKTLSKFIPDSDGSKQNGVPQTPRLTPVSKNTVLQKPRQGPSLNTASPQSIGGNTLTQPQLTVTALTPKRLQHNTNGAKTTTTNTQSPVAPSSQSSPSGKTTPSFNTGGATSSGSIGGGGGPLYRFNYVLDYNSHHEEGRIDGSKEGKYNTIHDDGIRRIIDYIANENGYQPHIKLERPPPNELPTGENKLKEYEFLWFN